MLTLLLFLLHAYNDIKQRDQAARQREQDKQTNKQINKQISK